MKHNSFEKSIIFSVVFALVMLLCSCHKKPTFSMDDFENHRDTTAITHTFSANDSSDPVVYSESGLQDLQDTLMSQPVTYGYDELFDYDKALAGIKSGLTVEKHTYSALDQDGNLTESGLFAVVRENNKAYLDGQTSLLQDVEDDLLHRICEILVETINAVLEQHPQIDRQRVYCNLGNLKVIVKSSALDFAAVEPGMVLHVNPSTANMAGLFTSSNMHSVLVHESMHILQYGCTCEQVEGCIRRCGLAYAYAGVEQDYSDWIWLAEGSAERMTCLQSRVEPMTYQNLVNYILSMDLAVVLKEDVPANYIETVSFYNDLDRLFLPFDAKSEADKKEIYQMLYSLEIMQMEPADVKEAYQRLYGDEWTNEIRDDVNNRLKRSVVQSFTKRFYYNLAEAILNNTVSKNDVLFLLNLYDSTIDYHVLFSNPNYDGYNESLTEWYARVQEQFFDALENLSLEDYVAYQAYDETTKTIHAGMNWLEEEKQTFLIEKFEDHFCDYKFIGIK